MGGSTENVGVLELLGKECSPASSENLLKDRPALLPSSEQSLIGSCFLNARSWNDADEEFCPLRQANAELKAEHSSLLLRNSELLSQTLLLKLENQQLKRQLELQLQKQQLSSSFSAASSSIKEMFTDSDTEDEEKLARTSSYGTSSEDTDTAFSF